MPYKPLKYCPLNSPNRHSSLQISATRKENLAGVWLFFQDGITTVHGKTAQNSFMEDVRETKTISGLKMNVNGHAYVKVSLVSEQCNNILFQRFH